MPSKKQRGTARRNRVLLFFGVAALLLLTAVYQLVSVNHALSSPSGHGHPKYIDQFEDELRKVQSMQDTVRAHIADIEATRDAGLDAANTHAQDLVESHAEIADLTKSIHKLQAKYALSLIHI